MVLTLTAIEFLLLLIAYETGLLQMQIINSKTMISWKTAQRIEDLSPKNTTICEYTRYCPLEMCPWSEFIWLCYQNVFSEIQNDSTFNVIARM